MPTVKASRLPTVSVIMPNYNHGPYLPYSLGAILNQSLRPLEVLVYDDGSTDDSMSIVREIAAKDPIVRLVADTHKAGPNANLNRGLREARGDFVYPAAADDYVLPGFFEKAMTLLAQNPSAKLCVADLAQFDAVTGRVRYLRPRLRPDAGYVSRDEVANRMAHQRAYMYGSMAVFSRTALLELGGFEPALKWYADWFTVLALALRHGACYFPETLATMRMLPGSYSAAGRKNHAVQDEVFRQMFDLLRSNRYADVGAQLLGDGRLCLLGSQILRVLLADSRYRDILSLRLLARLLANIPVTLFGLNPATQSPLGFLDRTVRTVLGLDGSIQQYGVPLDKPVGKS
jgi:glycosyltransferase involved in cell wall biosynthesis